MTILSNGNVGINITTPSNALTLNNIAQRGFANRASTAPSNYGLMLYDSNAGGLALGSFYTAGTGVAGTIQASDTFGSPATLTATQLLLNPIGGSVGIGTSTTAPRSLVDIFGPTYMRLPVSVSSATSLTLSVTAGSRNDGTYFFLTNAGFNTVNGSAYTAATDGGSFWTLYNSTGSYLSVTISNVTTVTPNLNPFPIPPYSSATLVVHPTNNNTLLVM